MKGIKPSVELLRKWKTTGAVSFSSSFLVDKMVKCIDFRNAKVIVELGAGNGCITRKLLVNMSEDSTLISLEINEDFCNHLDQSINDCRLNVICGNAITILKNVGTDIDYIVSSIPFKSISKDEREQLIASIKNASSPKTVFIQFSYFISMYSFFRNNYQKVKIDFTPLNLPPAFVFRCGYN